MTGPLRNLLNSASVMTFPNMLIVLSSCLKLSPEFLARVLTNGQSYAMLYISSGHAPHVYRRRTNNHDHQK